MNDEFGGVAMEEAPETDSFGGVALASEPAGRDRFGGVPLGEPALDTGIKEPSREVTKISDVTGGGKRVPLASAGETLASLADVPSEQWEEMNTPLKDVVKPLTAEEMQTLGKGATKGQQIEAGLAQSGAEAANWFTSPMGIATLGLGGAPKAMQKVLAGTFAALFAAHAPDAYKQVSDELKKPEPDYLQVSRTLGSEGLNALMLGLAAKHSFAEGPRPAEAVRTEAAPAEMPAAVPAEPKTVPLEVVPDQEAVQASGPTGIEPTVEKPGDGPFEGRSAGPGAASTAVGEVGGLRSQMAQLTDLVRNYTATDQALGERVGFADQVADALTDGKDAATRALGRVQSTAAAFRDSLTKLPAFTDFKRTLGDWLGANQKADLEARDFVKAVERQVPNRSEREAMTNWIQADGDESVLRQRAEASRGSVKRGYEAALKLTEEQKTLARNISQYFDARLKEGIESGMLSAGIENYVTQLWSRENPVTKELRANVQTGMLTPDFNYARQRVFDSYFEGEQAGYVPATKDIGRLVAIYDQSFNRTSASRAFLKQMSQAKASDGRPLTAVSGRGATVPRGEGTPEAILVKATTKPEAVADYKTIDHPAMRGWRWAEATEDGTPIMVQGNLLVHPEAYKHLRNVLQSGFLRQSGLGRGFSRVQSVSKQTAFSLSPFHLVQEGTHAAGHGVNSLRLVKLDLNDPAQMLMVKRGLKVASFDAWQDLQDGMFGGGPIINKIPIIGKWQQGFSEWLFHDYIPRLKMTMALDAYQRNLKRYGRQIETGRISNDQVAELTSRQSNAAFGELNYKYMGRNPHLQDVMRVFLVAPDFLEARGRFVGQAVKPYGQEQLSALGKIAATQYISARILNKVLDDDYHWNKPFKVIHNGHEYGLRTVPSDIGELLTDFGRFSRNRLSLSANALTEFFTGRDYRGAKVSGAEQLKDVLSRSMPMSLRPPKGGENLWQGALNAAGLRNKPYTPEMQTRELANKWLKENEVPNRVEVIGDSVYGPLRGALEDGNTPKVQEEMMKLHRAGKTGEDIYKGMEQWAHGKFTGSPKTELRFVASLDGNERRAYFMAKMGREQMLARLKAFTGQ